MKSSKKRVFHGRWQQLTAGGLIMGFVVFSQLLASQNVATWAARFLSVLLLIPLVSDGAIGSACVCFAGSALLGFALIGDVLTSLFYVLTGYYAVFRHVLERRCRRPVVRAIKAAWSVAVLLILFCLFGAAGYAAVWEEWLAGDAAKWQMPLLAVGVLGGIYLLDRLYGWVYQWYDEEFACAFRRKKEPDSRAAKSISEM